MKKFLDKKDSKKIFTLFGVIAILISLGLNYSINFCQNKPISKNENNNFFRETNAYENIKKQLNFGYRLPGTKESKNCLDWIASEMALYCQNDFYDFKVNNTNCRHLISKMNEGEEKITIIAAHYDSRAVGDKDKDYNKRNKPISGANDGASGVSVLIELARILNQNKVDLKNEIWFLFIDAEDQGDISLSSKYKGWNWCEGSKWLANDMSLNKEKYFAPGKSMDSISEFILLDLVGGKNLKFIREGYSSKELMDKIFNVGHSLGFVNEFPLADNSYEIEDDHVYFAQKNIPTLDLIINFWDENSGWPYHHTSLDTLANISEKSLDVSGETIFKYLSQKQ